MIDKKPWKIQEGLDIHTHDSWVAGNPKIYRQGKGIKYAWCCTFTLPTYAPMCMIATLKKEFFMCEDVLREAKTEWKDLY